jgi:hypothetical protein
VGALAFGSATLSRNKTAGIIAVSRELAMLATPGSEQSFRDELSFGATSYVGRQMLDPTSAPIAGTSPGSLLYNAPSFGSAGSSSANTATDFKKAINLFVASNPDAESPAVIMNKVTASALGFALNVSSITTGTSLFGFTVIVNSAASNRLIALDARQVLIADNNEMDIVISQQATIELSTTATSPPTAATAYVSLFQAGLIAYRVDRWISWKLGRPSAAIYTTVSYT